MPTALFSVYDKKGMLPLAKGLKALGWHLLATGGTLHALQEAGVEVQEVAEYTGAPEAFGGRVRVFVSGGAPLGVFLLLRRMALVGDAMSHAILPGAMPGTRWRSILGRLYLFMARSHSSMLKRRMRPIFTNGKMRRRIKLVIVRRSQR